MKPGIYRPDLTPVAQRKLPQPGEILMKDWLAREAIKHGGCGVTTILMRLQRNPAKYYPGLEIRRVNKRVVFVKMK